MRLIIEGKAYDTDKATRVTGGDNSPWPSGAWWSLYRTDNGTFFKIIVDHDGETLLECSTLTDAQARANLEKHANHLVEQYFGPMPEPGLRFSRRTVIAAVEIMEGAIRIQADLTRCLLKWSPALAARCDEGALPDRFNHLIKFFDEQPDRHLEDGNLLGDELVEKAVSLFSPIETPVPCREPSTLSPQVAIFLRALDRDGFTVADGVLRRTLPAILKLPEAEDEIFRLLKKHDFAVAKGHLEQAFAAHTDGLWASANSQIRSFLDGLLDEIAERIDPSATTLASGQPRRTKLALCGFLSRELNEWDDSGTGFVNGLVKRLHPHGSHPGLSDQDDSTFRLHIVLLTARLLLVRFDKWGKP